LKRRKKQQESGNTADMFKPERMSLMQIVILDDDIIPACAYLADKKIVHLEDRSIITPALREGTPTYFSSSQTDLEMILGQLQTLSVWVGEPKASVRREAKKEQLLIDPQQVVEDIKPSVNEALEQFEQLKKQHDDGNREIRRLTRISDTLQSFETAGVACNELMQFKYFAFLSGTMPRRYLSALRRSLHQVPYHLEIRSLGEDEISLIVLCPNDVLTSVRSTLKSLYFSEVAIPKEYQDDPVAALDTIEILLWQLREEIALAVRKMNTLRETLTPRAIVWQRMVRANLRVLNAMQLFGKTARTTFINGWVPRSMVATVIHGMKGLLNERVTVEVSDPDEDTGLAHELMSLDKIRVPTKFKHPAFLKPFEGLVTTYGYPDYNGIDPTLFVALTFLFMFGMMFGDVGHGLVLVALGLFIAQYKKTRKISPAGWLLVAAGCSSIIFGFMYGSIFGYEGLLFHHVWLNPRDQVPQLFVSAIGVGVCVLSLGIILNVVQAANTKNYREAFFGQWGLCSGMFYWMALGIFYLMGVSGAPIPGWLTVTVLLVPIILIVVGDIFYNRIFGGRKEQEESREEEHGTAETLFKPAEVILGFMTQTVSFVRVGAFALNHAILMFVVFVLANIGGGFNGPEATFNSKIYYVTSVILGNIFVMLLEGLIVFIQCLRLEYYEFFSKFFKGDGVKYEPFQVEDI
jgi:V/A-type H+-transporting ATPase subunit I